MLFRYILKKYMNRTLLKDTREDENNQKRTHAFWVEKIQHQKDLNSLEL